MGVNSSYNNSVFVSFFVSFFVSVSLLMRSSSRWVIALFLLTPAMMAVNYVLGQLAFGLIAPYMLALLR